MFCLLWGVMCQALSFSSLHSPIHTVPMLTILFVPKPGPFKLAFTASPPPKLNCCPPFPPGRAWSARGAPPLARRRRRRRAPSPPRTLVAAHPRRREPSPPRAATAARHRAPPRPPPRRRVGVFVFVSISHSHPKKSKQKCLRFPKGFFQGSWREVEIPNQMLSFEKCNNLIFRFHILQPPKCSISIRISNSLLNVQCCDGKTFLL